MTRSKLVISGVVLALGTGGLVRPASADRGDNRLVDFIGWGLRLIHPPDPCSPPDPCRWKLETDIAPRQHTDVNQIFFIGHHAARAFQAEARLLVEIPPGPPSDGENPPGPPSDGEIPPGPPQTPIALRFDVIDTANTVVITVPDGFELVPVADRNGHTAYTLAPSSGRNTLP